MSDLAHAAYKAAASNGQPKPEDLYVYVLICTPGFYPYDNVETTRDYIEDCAASLEIAKSLLADEDSKDGLGWQLMHDRWRFDCKDEDPNADLDLEPEQIAQNASEYTGASYCIEKHYLRQALRQSRV